MKTTEATAIIFDDHRLFTDSFSALIERIELFRFVHTFNDYPGLIKFLINSPSPPIYLFLDYYLKDKNGLQLINEIKRLNKQVKIVIMSSVVSSTTVAHILNYSPEGLVSKSSGFDVILQCLDSINRGERYLCPVISEIVAKASLKSTILFTARELEVLQFFAKGFSIVQTAEQIHLSKHTIVAHRRKMMEKANANSITELLAYARMEELI